MVYLKKRFLDRFFKRKNYALANFKSNICKLCFWHSTFTITSNSLFNKNSRNVTFRPKIIAAVRKILALIFGHKYKA